ncbi:M24 family metallopeptidase [Cupriavidus sp. PET2-C1]
MESTSRLDREAVGAKFSLPAMQYARDKTFEGVQRIAAGIRPGMTEKQACDFARITLEAMGMQRIWHQIIVRFGRNTLKTFKERIDPDHVLGAHDIFFIDLGIVWDDHEGDAGDTFVVGEDPEMHACAEAARVLWREVSARWREDGLGGPALYQYAAQRAEAAGWKLNLEIKGHRVSDFPHAIYRAGDLGDYEPCPKTGLWILEIQIAHPTRPFGAFYEDILIAS